MGKVALYTPRAGAIGWPRMATLSHAHSSFPSAHDGVQARRTYYASAAKSGWSKLAEMEHWVAIEGPPL